MSSLAASVLAADPSARAAAPAPRPVRRPDPRPTPRPARPAPPAAVAGGAPGRQVVLRRRLAVGALVVALAGGALAVGFGVGQAGAGIDGPPATTPIYVVQPGDTLWDIAHRLAPEVDTARAVAELRRVAGGVALVPGQRIAVPAALR